MNPRKSLRLGWLVLMVVSASGEREANADFGVRNAESGGGGEPFLGAYIHLPSWFRGKTDEADRERAIMDNLDRFRESGSDGRSNGVLELWSVGREEIATRDS